MSWQIKKNVTKLNIIFSQILVTYLSIPDALEEQEVTDVKPVPAVSNQDGSHIVKNGETFTKEVYVQTAPKLEDTTQQRLFFYWFIAKMKDIVNLTYVFIILFII